MNSITNAIVEFKERKCMPQDSSLIGFLFTRNRHNRRFHNHGFPEQSRDKTGDHIMFGGTASSDVDRLDKSS